MSISESELIAVDNYIAKKEKTLDGPQPEWTKNGRGDYQVSWPIKETDTGVIRSGLRLRIPIAAYHNPSIGLVFRRNMVSRVDRAKRSACEPNPPYAQRKGLPSRVCGPHVHLWSDNRDHVALTGLWELPARRGVTNSMQRINQMFFWFCDEIHVRIPDAYRMLNMPDRGFFEAEHA